jgi:CubicO group peptidase (beta-lactamase class C family)
MTRRAALVLLAGLALLVLLAIALLASARFSRHAPDVPRVVVGGGDAGGLPRAQPSDERIDAAALERAVQDAAAGGLQALLVMRDGHVVFEHYGRGQSADTVIDSGPMAQVLVALAAGVAAKQGALSLATLRGFDANALRAALEAGTQQRYELYLSHAIWSRLNAAAAWIELPASGAPTPADCCFHARMLDWMRVASLLVDDGRFEGKQIVPPGWVARMARPVSLDSVHGFGVEIPATARGAEAFAADGVFFLRGPGRCRLWLVPALRLAVLFAADAPKAPAALASASTWDETRIPNLVIRAVSDRPMQRGDVTDLQRLVPGH